MEIKYVQTRDITGDISPNSVFGFVEFTEGYRIAEVLISSMMSGCLLSEAQVRYGRVQYFVLCISVFSVHIIFMWTCSQM